MNTLLTVLLCVLMGWICSHCARRRGRNPMLWFISGTCFGIFALAALFLMPPLKPTLTLKNEQPTGIMNPSLTTLAPTQASKLWYYLDAEKKQLGPMSFDALSRAWGEGKVTAHTFVWNEELESWKRFNEVISPATSLP